MRLLHGRHSLCITLCQLGQPSIPPAAEGDAQPQLGAWTRMAASRRAFGIFLHCTRAQWEHLRVTATSTDERLWRVIRNGSTPGARRGNVVAGGLWGRAVHGELPVIFLNDGQNLFDDKLSFSGSSWRASDAALRLMEDNSLPMAMIVGIDHAGKDRSLYYCPYKPGTGVGDFRPEAELWKGGKVNEYLDFVVEDLVGVINREYGSSMDPNQMIFGGSSFGGICTLCMSMRYPEQFGGVIVESPSYWMGEGKFLEDLRDYTGAWPERMFLASGKQEYTGTRKNGMDEVDDLLNRYFEESVDILAQQGLVGDRIHTWLEEGGAHTESAWARRLPAALRFLGTPLQARRRRDRLYFTMPQTLQAGEPMTLYFNPKASGSLAGEAELELRSAFNMWGVQPQDMDLQRYQPFPVSDPEHEWMAATVAVPEDAWEMNFVFKARGRELWEDNAGANFRRVVRGSRDDTNEEQIEAARAAARAAADGPADDAAHRNRGKLLFTTPKSPVAGEPLAVYMNRAASLVGLKNSPNVKLHYSFNDWAHGKKDQSLLPTSLWRDEGTDWWGCKIEVPSDAFEFNLCFSDGGHVWESNNSNNWNIRVRSVEAASRPPARQIEHTDVNDHAGGKLHIIRLTKREGRGSRRAKWTEEKTLRVWTPGGYDRNNLPPGGMPVLYFCDGQNLFEDWLAHQGVSWRAGFAAAHLIGVGAVPPFVICAIDGAGPYRSYQYLPWPPGEGAGGFRGDAERWPGGGVDDFLERVIHEIMPLVTEEFGTATAPDKVAFAGGSFGGIAALYAGLKYPDVFGSVLAESPSLWSAEGRFLHEMGIHLGQLPERVWLAVGTHEYSATRDHDRPEIDELLLHYGQECARILQEKGCHGDRLGFQIEQDAGHHEGAWAYRLQGALHYLLAPWWDHYR